MNELAIPLDGGTKIPLYEQIYEYIKKEIQSGGIRCGDRLPSTRALARNLDVSRSTVELSYGQLLSEGYIETKPRKGFFAAQVEELVRIERTADVWEETPGGKRETYRYDFSPSGIDLQSFPHNTWRKLSREVLLEDGTELFKLGDSQGEYPLRRAICEYLHHARGVSCTPGQIVVGAGNDYLMLLLANLLGRRRYAFETPTYKQAFRLFEKLSCEVCTVPMDKAGMNVEALTGSGAEIAYVMPSHQYPLGIVMPIQRRMELLRWAARGERYIIEDDYDSEFRYKGKPIPALQGFDGNGTVIYLGTFSRSIAPAIRMSYMVLPEKLLRLYQREYQFLSSTVPKVDQRIVERFLSQGYYERHLNKMRALYKSRHDVLLNSLKPLLPVGKISGEHAGMHLLLTMQNGMSEEEVLRIASENGIRLYGLSACETEETSREGHTVLLGFANLPEEDIREGAELLTRQLLEADKRGCRPQMTAEGRAGNMADSGADFT